VFGNSNGDHVTPNLIKKNGTLHDMDSRSLTEISLFSGYGGFTLGLRLAGVDTQTVCYVENDSYCQRLLVQRMADGFLDDAPLWDDVRTFDGRPWRGYVDIVTAGFPCQPHSVAGQRRGEAGERNLWPDTLRVIREVEPSYCLLENVPGLVHGNHPYAATVIADLSDIGYDAVWHLVPAASVGAPHLRWRWWCLAYAQCSAVSQQQGRKRRQRPTRLEPGRTGEADARWDGQDGAVADADGNGCRNQRGGHTAIPEFGRTNPRTSDKYSSWWAVEPRFCGMVTRIAPRLDIVGAAATGVLPAMAAG